MNPTEKLQKVMEFAIKNRPQIGGFPFLAECLRLAEVTRNIWLLPAATSMYVINDEYIVNQGVPLINGMAEVPTFDEVALIRAIRSDQAGQTSFPEFLLAAWNAGVSQYDVDFNKRTVTYIGARGETYTEEYAAVDVPDFSI